MASRRLGEVPIELPPNAKALHFQRTDGESRLWPTSTARIVDHEGQVNYMRHLDLDTPTALKWRLGVARAIANDKGMPENEEYVLAGWPDGYRLFDHNKGPEHNPRHDVYLFGSRKGRFRSINEFIPHALWLMRDDSQEHESCSCKYCSKKAQKEITASISGILRSSPTGTSPSPTRLKPSRERKPRQAPPDKPRERGRDSRAYAAVQKRPEVEKQAMLVERNSDLRAVSSRTDMKLKRWFREGELVWCDLGRSISGPDQSEDVAIRFWPALVDETRLKSQAVNHEGVSDPQAYLKTNAGNVQNANGDSEVEGYPQEPPWTISQYYSYKVHLLVTNNTLIVPDDRILPYQALAPSNGLMNAMSSFPPNRLDLNRDSLRSFNPCADYKIDFDSAIAPYAMALQIAGALSAYWCLTDEWTATFTLPPVPPVPPPARPPAPESLQDAIAQAHRHNAETSTLIRPTVSDPGIPVTQFRYQGLWWGGERIWADDFIRLKVPRRSLAPNGAEKIAPASGPGKEARDVWLQQGRDPSELGAGARGVFMRLDALIVVDVYQSDGKPKKECRACGMLYELADKDWEELKTDVIEQNFAESGKTVRANDPPQQASATSETQQVQSDSQFTVPVIPVRERGLSQPGTPLTLRPDTEPKKQSDTKSRYLLPEAPEGYRFRPILPEGHEAVISLSLISGRYYPRLLSHPLLDDTLRKAIARPPEEGGLSESNNLWALEGLSAGYYNSVDPTHYKSSRSLMIEEADKAAKEQLEQYKTQFVAGEQLMYPMEVDL